MVSPQPVDPFKDLNIYTETYRTVGDHPIQADVMIPKNAAPGSHAVVFNFHGGGLVCGSRKQPEVFPLWLSDWAIRTSSIIISADFRLVPESNGLDILSDLEVLWTWLHSSLPSRLSTLAPGHDADLSRILSLGSSGGAWCALQLGFAHADAIRGIFLMYPDLNLGSESRVKGAEAMGETNPLQEAWQVPKAEVDDHVNGMKVGDVVTVGEDFSRVRLVVGLGYYGRWQEFFGKEKVLYPFERIKEGVRLPKKVLVVHGNKDTMVPFGSSEEFVGLVKKYLPNTDVKLVVAEGKDHGYDYPMGLEEPSIREAARWIEEAWQEQ
ncbi:MAG: hypothetical protein M1820_005952 [Bogoriella megaspora]|nr:MAG: hypothetical protein M1820_005952 [Bogoriella megaspora]